MGRLDRDRERKRELISNQTQLFHRHKFKHPLVSCNMINLRGFPQTKKFFKVTNIFGRHKSVCIYIYFHLVQQPITYINPSSESRQRQRQRYTERRPNQNKHTHSTPKRLISSSNYSLLAHPLPQIPIPSVMYHPSTPI